MFYMLFCAVDHQKEIAEDAESAPLKILRPVGCIGSIAREFAVPASSTLGVRDVMQEQLCTHARYSHAVELVSAISRKADSWQQACSACESRGQTEDKKQSLVDDQQRKAAAQREWHDRVVWGSFIALAAAWAVVAGGWWFTWGIGIMAMGAAWEYLQLINTMAKRKAQQGLAKALVYLCCLLCLMLPLATTLFNGRVGWTFLAAGCLLVAAQAAYLQPNSSAAPRQMQTLLFGLFYCGYLPSFWIKVRFGFSPFLNSSSNPWEVVDGDVGWSIGPVATFLAFSAVIAADSFAYIGGKAFGRTKLTSISPKKTWEGAAAGLVASVLVTVGLSKLFHWPASTLSVGVMATLIFLTAVFGDLYESWLKREAGVKDSGKLIPGHGGVLDRIDSYIFTGLVVYCFTTFLSPYL